MHTNLVTEKERKANTLKLANLPFNCSSRDISHWIEQLGGTGITIKRHRSSYKENCGIVHFKNEESKEKAKEISRLYKGKAIYFCNSETVTCFSCGEKGHMAGDHNKTTYSHNTTFKAWW